jgi:hypothetical protein
MKDEDKERFWNLVIYKMYVTNKEMELIFPGLIIFAIILGIALGIVYFFLK